MEHVPYCNLHHYAGLLKNEQTLYEPYKFKHPHCPLHNVLTDTYVSNSSHSELRASTLCLVYTYRYVYHLRGGEYYDAQSILTSIILDVVNPMRAREPHSRTKTRTLMTILMPHTSNQSTHILIRRRLMRSCSARSACNQHGQSHQ